MHALRDPARHGRGLRGVQGAGVLLIGSGERRVRGILFDAGNTLVHIDPDRMVEVYRRAGAEVAASSFRAAELEARRCLHERIDEGSNGTEPELWGAYFRRLFELTDMPEALVPGVSEGVRAEHAREHLWTYADPSTADTLRTLASDGYRVGVVSNADGRMERALVRAGVRDHVEFVIDSGAVGFEKPDPRIFHAGCEALGLEPGECLYVGDLYPVDYLGATAAGLAAALVDPLGLHAERAETVARLGELPGLLRAPDGATAADGRGAAAR